MTDAHPASHLRHDVPQDVRDGGLQLHSLVSRYARAMNHQWVADEVSAKSLPLLLEIAREALAAHQRHARFLASSIFRPEGGS